MFAAKDAKKRVTGFAPLRKEQTSRDKADSARQAGNLPGSPRFLQRDVGNSCRQSIQEGLGETVQAKLTIGQPNDLYEQEADRVAEQVMCMPEPNVQSTPT